MINIKDYIEKKEKGLISIAKLGSGFAMSSKKFNPDTGEEAEPEVAGFHIQDLEKIKTGLQKTIADIDVLIEDINVLK